MWFYTTGDLNELYAVYALVGVCWLGGGGGVGYVGNA